MATKMRQTEEDRRAMEAKMSDRIQELEAKMKQMKTKETPVVRYVIWSKNLDEKQKENDIVTLLHVLARIIMM